MPFYRGSHVRFATNPVNAWSQKECDTLLFFFCSPLLSLVLSSPRRPPLAVLLWRMSRCEASAVRLYGVFGRWVTHVHACGGSVCCPSCPLSLSLFLFFFFLLPWSPSLSLPLSSSSPQPMISITRPSCLLISREDIFVLLVGQNRGPWAICCRFCLGFRVHG